MVGLIFSRTVEEITLPNFLIGSANPIILPKVTQTNEKMKEDKEDPCFNDCYKLADLDNMILVFFLILILNIAFIFISRSMMIGMKMIILSLMMLSNLHQIFFHVIWPSFAKSHVMRLESD